MEEGSAVVTLYGQVECGRDTRGNDVTTKLCAIFLLACAAFDDIEASDGLAIVGLLARSMPHNKKKQKAKLLTTTNNMYVCGPFDHEKVGPDGPLRASKRCL